MMAIIGHLNSTLDKDEAEYRILTNSGEYRWFYDYGSVVKKDLNRAPLICTGIVNNISEIIGKTDNDLPWHSTEAEKYR